MLPTYLGLVGGSPWHRSIKPCDSYDLQRIEQTKILRLQGRVLGFEGFKVVLRWGNEETRPGSGLSNRRLLLKTVGLQVMGCNNHATDPKKGSRIALQTTVCQNLDAGKIVLRSPFCNPSIET
jgi:hypothetical protein